MYLELTAIEYQLILSLYYYTPNVFSVQVKTCKNIVNKFKFTYLVGQNISNY